MSREMADKLGVKPLFSIIDYAEVSQPTKDIATVPGLSIKKVLDQNDMTLDEVDLIENKRGLLQPWRLSVPVQSLA